MTFHDDGYCGDRPAGECMPWRAIRRGEPFPSPLVCIVRTAGTADCRQHPSCWYCVVRIPVLPALRRTCATATASDPLHNRARDAWQVTRLPPEPLLRPGSAY
ncbi:hypothetical protein KNE206_78640 [Kitasatospora sp. NE20-6]